MATYTVRPGDKKEYRCPECKEPAEHIDGDSDMIYCEPCDLFVWFRVRQEPVQEPVMPGVKESNAK